jgi:hypothetical protein
MPANGRADAADERVAVSGGFGEPQAVEAPAVKSARVSETGNVTG